MSKKLDEAYLEALDKIADLEKQLAGFNKFMEINEWSSIQEMQDTLNTCEQKYFEQQHNLAEKDEKIEELKDLVNIWKTKLCEKMETQILSVTKEKEQQIRHQVCEEIRDKFSHWGYIGNPEMLSKQKCLEILDQIEGANDDN